MNELVRTLDNKIREYLSPETELHRVLDTHKFSYDEIYRRCDPKNEEDHRIVTRFLSYIWCDLGPGRSDQFFSLIEDQDFLDIKKYPIDYNKIIKATSSNISIRNPKFNIIVPVKNRKDHLDSFIANASKVIRGKNDWAITVVFQEEEDTIYHEYVSREYPSDLNLNFINIPHDDWFVSAYGDNMNRSLCYNIVSLMIECEYQINHDVDLIFGTDFLENIETKTRNTDFKWLQPYRGSRVIMLDQDESQIIRDCLRDGLDFTFPQKNIPLAKTPLQVGAPGGSIVVRHSDFIDIGGYDPEIVWGYAPEDSLFWYKLEAKLGCVRSGKKIHPFCSVDVFSHETEVELYHIYHPPTIADKRMPFCSTFLVSWLLTKSSRSLLEKWLEISKNKLKV